MGLGRKKKERGEKSGNKAEEKYRGEEKIVKKNEIFRSKEPRNSNKQKENRGLVEKQGIKELKSRGKIVVSKEQTQGNNGKGGIKKGEPR